MRAFVVDPYYLLAYQWQGLTMGTGGGGGHVTHCTSGQTKSKTVLVIENWLKFYSYYQF